MYATDRAKLGLKAIAILRGRSGHSERPDQLERVYVE